MSVSTFPLPVYFHVAFLPSFISSSALFSFLVLLLHFFFLSSLSPSFLFLLLHYLSIASVLLSLMLHHFPLPFCIHFSPPSSLFPFIFLFLYYLRQSFFLHLSSLPSSIPYFHSFFSCLIFFLSSFIFLFLLLFLLLSHLRF